MFWRFPFIGWSRVHTGVEVVGGKMIVQEVWFNWCSRQKWIRKAIITGFNPG